MKRKKAGVHSYRGGRTSRGKRRISKFYKGIKVGDIRRAFEEVEKLRVQNETKGIK